MYGGAMKTAAANANAAQSGGPGREMRSKSSTTIEEVKEGAQEGEGDDGGVTAVAAAAVGAEEAALEIRKELSSRLLALDRSRATLFSLLSSLFSLLSSLVSRLFSRDCDCQYGDVEYIIRTHI